MSSPPDVARGNHRAKLTFEDRVGTGFENGSG
jgi:hypothetical protein